MPEWFAAAAKCEKTSMSCELPAKQNSALQCAGNVLPPKAQVSLKPTSPGQVLNSYFDVRLLNALCPSVLRAERHAEVTVWRSPDYMAFLAPQAIEGSFSWRLGVLSVGSGSARRCNYVLGQPHTAFSGTKYRNQPKSS